MPSSSVTKQSEDSLISGERNMRKPCEWVKKSSPAITRNFTDKRELTRFETCKSCCQHRSPTVSFDSVNCSFTAETGLGLELELRWRKGHGMIRNLIWVFSDGTGLGIVLVTSRYYRQLV